VIDERDLALPSATVGVGRFDIHRPFRDVKQEVIDAFERGYLTELLRDSGQTLGRLDARYTSYTLDRIADRPQFDALRNPFRRGPV